MSYKVLMIKWEEDRLAYCMRIIYMCVFFYFDFPLFAFAIVVKLVYAHLRIVVKLRNNYFQIFYCNTCF